MEPAAWDQEAMRTLGIVPARAGSRRLPSKNLLTIGGESLALRALRCALACDDLDRIVVSSDDNRVLQMADAMCPGSALKRPAELSTAESPAIDYIRHALDSEQAMGADDYDAVVVLQPTSPFRMPGDISDVLDALSRDPAAASAVTVVRVRHDVHPAKFKTFAGKRLIPFLLEEAGLRTYDELPEVFVRDGGVYAFRTTALGAADPLSGISVGVEIPAERAIDINDSLDFAFAEFMWGRLKDSEDFAW